MKYLLILFSITILTPLITNGETINCDQTSTTIDCISGNEYMTPLGFIGLNNSNYNLFTGSGLYWELYDSNANFIDSNSLAGGIKTFNNLDDEIYILISYDNSTYFYNPTLSFTVENGKYYLTTPAKTNNGNIEFGIGIIIVLLSLSFIGFIWNRTTKPKWKS